MTASALLTVLLLLTPFLTIHPAAEGRQNVIIDWGVNPSPAASIVWSDMLDTELDGFATARIPPPYVELLKKAGAEVYRPRILRPMLDLSTLDIGLNIVANVSGVNAGRVDGSGVLIAFVDTGVDYMHPAFKSRDGGSRILYIWDQTVDGRHPQGFGYGHECLPEDVLNGLCPQRDTVGHGTIIASIAAGGSYGGWRLRGVAPGAELIVVKSGGPACGGRRWFFDEKGVIDGIAYAVEKARLLGRRLVVVLSLGTDIGGHDGNTPLEKALDKWADEGVVFVVAAGNSAGDARHVTGVLIQGRNTTLTWAVPSETQHASMSIVTGRDDNFTLYLTTPKGVTKPVKFNQTNIIDGFSAEVSLLQHGSSKEVLMSLSTSKNISGVWGLIISAKDVASGTWHAWVETDTCSMESESFLAGVDYTISESSTVTIPGTGRKVLTVGAYTTRTQWYAGGRSWSIGGVVGGLEYYSGRGPTIDGRTKPDLVAPGGVIIAAGSRDAVRQPYSPTNLTAVSRGTSMSAPHAAGVAALVLQLAPNLTVREVFEVLKLNSRVDEQTGPIPVSGSNSWGWGKLNADIAYIVKVTVIGKVEGAKPAIVVDGSKLLTAQQKTPFNIVLVKEIPHNITLILPQAGEGSMFKSRPSFFKPSQQQAEVLFNVYTVYRLRILHPNGSLLKEWWGEENGLVRLSELLTDVGLDGVVAGYRLEDGSEIRDGILSLTRPINVVLIFSGSTNFPVLVTGVSIALALTTTLIILLRSIKRRWLRQSGIP